jgi:hypothetical protein
MANGSWAGMTTTDSGRSKRDAHGRAGAIVSITPVVGLDLISAVSRSVRSLLLTSSQ